MIAYIDSNGKIVGGCWADSPDHINTITRIPDGCTAVYIDDTQYPDVWANMGEYTVQNGVPVHTPIPDDVKLANAKQAKIAELRLALTNAIATFQSSALGTPHTYLADEKSMTLLAAEYAYVKSPEYDGQPTPWYTVEQGRVPHTGAQIAQVFVDGRANVKAQYAHYDDLKAQVNAATTVDQVNAIKW
jgi:hypothetical protein